MIKADAEAFYIVGDRVCPDTISRDRESDDIQRSGNPEVISLLVIADKVDILIKVYGFLKVQIHFVKNEKIVIADGKNI